ncbi:MAG TPA: signal recognition particle protein Srp19 [Archaeoglobus profundus]|nr:signal recognition particle protein Srp19 [Archaeoglobus profundus]HIP58670.1 signal recognition particle protein Srp19 [Archaeoglobus profundus]
MKTCVIWTVNLDSRKTRSEGRKIPRKYAIPNVKLAELIQACKELGLEFEVEHKKYPKCWWEEGGRVVVPKTKSKIKLMIDIAKKIAEIRKRK